MKESEAEIVVDEHQGILTITINRPEQRNAMTLAASKRIATALDELDNRRDLSIGILTGAGGNFCAGMDLKRFSAGELASVEGRGFGGVTEQPPKKPLIAAVEGFALGGGFEMVLACDIVIASTSALFGLPEVRRGLVARGGGLLRLPLLIPRSVAMELIFTGNMLDATRAESLGLVNQVVPLGEALTAAQTMALTIARNAPLSLEVSKRIIIESPSWPSDQRFEIQREVAAVVFASDDAKEGARAFAEKRTPVWTGS